MQVVEITGATGSGPYDVYLCDYTFSYCVLISGSTTIPYVEFELPPVFEGTNSVIVKIIDLSSGCETFQLLTCPPTPTPTPSITPTVTPTMIVNCNCIRFDNPTTSGLTFSLTECDNTYLVSTIYSGTTLFYCGKLPSADSGVIISINGPCVGGSCPSIYLTPTPTNTPTPSPTNVVCPSIGDVYGGGIVAYVWQPGDPGYNPLNIQLLIAAPYDQSAAIIWGCQGTTIGGTSTDLGSGQVNTSLIVGGCGDPSFAALLCDSLSLGGYNDWFLPSSDELLQMCLNQVVIGGFSPSEYWSSSEFDSTRTYNTNFITTFCVTNPSFKDLNLLRVRAVRYDYC